MTPEHSLQCWGLCLIIPVRGKLGSGERGRGQCECPGAAVTKHHKQGIKRSKVCPPPVWRPEVQNQAVSTAAGKHPSLSLPASGSSDIPWLVATSLQSVPLSAPGLSLCLFLTNFSLLTRKPVTLDWVHAALIRPPLYL